MTKKRLAIIIWVVVGFLFLILGASIGSAKVNSQNTVGGTTSTATGSATDPSIEPTSEPTASDLPLPIDTPAPRPAGPKTFVMPDFTDMDENEVETWFWDHNLDVSPEFDYGDEEGTDCADAGDGIVEDQSPAKGTRLKNSISTDVYLAVYCDD
ncbi:MAG: hypothetical protein RLZZ600_720 [Actinomycetota bacterium]|jgi:hypothetical protein